MIRKYVAAFDDYIPSNDAQIMAEATIGNCYLLTNNVKDFIIFNFNSNDHRRVDGIKCINEQFKFSKLRNNKVFTPQPITLNSLIKFLRNYIPSKCIAITKNTQNLDLEV